MTLNISLYWGLWILMFLAALLIPLINGDYVKDRITGCLAVILIFGAITMLVKGITSLDDERDARRAAAIEKAICK